MEGKMQKPEDKSQPLISLCLGIGEGCSTTTTSDDDNKCQKHRNLKGEVDDHDFDHVVESVGCRNSSVVCLTQEQLKEFELQLIIYKYLVLGLPLPFHLLLPLWAGSHSRGTNHQDTMDPEPGRCRRTDGKKWRCYQSVVSNEKYCEKHMHRGRKRSRKLVEDVAVHSPNVNDGLSKNTDLIPAILAERSQLPAVEAPGLTLIDTAARIGEKMERNVEGHKCSNFQRHTNIQQQVSKRCSRKDGRKWLCHSEALLGHKYCTQHIHRGVRKQHPAISLQSSAPKPAKTDAGVGTDLNISLLDSRPPDDNREITTSACSSSDASTETTISDDSAYISNMITVSPKMQ